MTYTDFAVDMARQAGEIIRTNFGLGMKKEWKDNDTPLTETDTKINRLVIEQVKKYFPDHDVLGEEESDRSQNSKMLWVCDPVDGTIPFSHGVPTCCFSLALVDDGVPVLGVIYDPFMDRMFSAEKGKGAFLNGKPIHVNDRGLDNSVLDWESNSVPFRSKKKVLTLKLSCVMYGGMLVASGELVAAYYNWKFAHDAASLKVIVEEAGGRATDKHGNEQRYDGEINGALFSNGVVHQELVDYIKSVGSDKWWNDL